MSKSKKTFTLSEALQYLEDLEVSDAEECDIDLDISNYKSANIYVFPPENLNGESDVDSGDDEDGDVNNLNKNQLLSSAILEVNLPNGKVITVEQDDQQSTVKRQTMNRGQVARENMQQNHTSANGFIKICLMRHQTISGIINLSLQRMTLRHSFLKKFITDDILMDICTETKRYAAVKGDHSFDVDVDTMKAFIVILLVSGYVTLPRRYLYWEMKEDCKNIVVCGWMSRNRFDVIMKYLPGVVIMPFCLSQTGKYMHGKAFFILYQSVGKVNSQMWFSNHSFCINPKVNRSLPEEVNESHTFFHQLIHKHAAALSIDGIYKINSIK